MHIQIQANTTNQLPNLLSNGSYNAWAPPDSHPLWYTLVCYAYSKCTLYVQSTLLCIRLPARITPRTFWAQCAHPLHKTCKENQLPHLLSITTWCKSTPWLTYHFCTPWFAYSECTLHTCAALLCILLPAQITPNILNLMHALVPYTKTCVYSFPCSCSIWLTVHTIEHVCQQAQPALDHPRHATWLTYITLKLLFHLNLLHAQAHLMILHGNTLLLHNLWAPSDSPNKVLIMWWSAIEIVLNPSI